MSTNRTISLLITMLMITNISLSQNDNSLTYIDLIAQSNPFVKETLNQHIINWDEVPYKLDGVKRMKETFYRFQFDTLAVTDTIIYITELPDPATKAYSTNYEYFHLPDDTLKIIVDSFSTITYKGNKILSQADEGSTMKYHYYDSGILKSLQIGDITLMESQRTGDTILYKLNLVDILSNKIMKSENIPSISIAYSSSPTEDCFHYKNIFDFKKMLDKPIVNKEIIQCSDGRFLREMVLDRYSNYAEKAKDLVYQYDGSILTLKTNKEDVKYRDYMDFQYEYDSLGNLKKIIGYTQTNEFWYDDHNNVIKRMVYSSTGKNLHSFWIREIEYTK